MVDSTSTSPLSDILIDLAFWRSGVLTGDGLLLKVERWWWGGSRNSTVEVLNRNFGRVHPIVKFVGRIGALGLDSLVLGCTSWRQTAWVSGWGLARDGVRTVENLLYDDKHNSTYYPSV